MIHQGRMKNAKCKVQDQVGKGVNRFEFLRTGLASGSAVGDGASAIETKVVGAFCAVCGYDGYDDGGRGTDIYKVEPVHRSLEEVFLELVGEDQ